MNTAIECSPPALLSALSTAARSWAGVAGGGIVVVVELDGVDADGIDGVMTVGVPTGGANVATDVVSPTGSGDGLFGSIDEPAFTPSGPGLGGATLMTGMVGTTMVVDVVDRRTTLRGLVVGDDRGGGVEVNTVVAMVGGCAGVTGLDVAGSGNPVIGGFTGGTWAPATPPIGEINETGEINEIATVNTDAPTTRRRRERIMVIVDIRREEIGGWEEVPRRVRRATPTGSRTQSSRARTQRSITRTRWCGKCIERHQICRSQRN